jgi:hypothetical protein
MASVDTLEASDDDEDDTDEDDDEEETGDVIGGFGGPGIELSKLLEVSSKRGVFDDPQDDNCFEDPDARFPLFNQELTVCVSVCLVREWGVRLP